MDLGLRGRRAIVGGATSGLGRASAEALAAEGCDLVIWSRSEERLASIADKLRATYGVSVEWVAANASDPSAATTVAEAALAGGDVDILVSNAGGPPTVDPTQTDPETWRQIFQLLAATPIELATLPPAADARARLGPGGRHHVDRRAAADPRAGLLERRSLRAVGVAEDHRTRGGSRWRHDQRR